MYTANIFPDDTIVAPATANGIAALGVIRVSGKNAFTIVNQVFMGTPKTHNWPLNSVR